MKSETKINIASASHIGALYDNGIKLLFRCKEIIVPIMEMVVPEFSDCSQQQIANCLDISSVSSEEIVKRALYYVARSFSEQLSVITGKTDYSILEKCYSIWIYSGDIPGKLQDTMTQYSIKKKDIFQETDEPEADYDLMTVIIIRRGKGTEKESIFDYLNGVFSCDIDKIEKYSHVEWAETFREEMKTMTGFGDALIEKGREQLHLSQFSTFVIC